MRLELRDDSLRRFAAAVFQRDDRPRIAEHVVALYAFAVDVHHREIFLGLGMSQLREFAIQLEGSREFLLLVGGPVRNTDPPRQRPVTSSAQTTSVRQQIALIVSYDFPLHCGRSP